MSVDQLPQNASRPAGAEKLIEYESYIDRQIQSTRRAVKVVDIATLVVSFAATAISFMLAVALIEHWVLPNGFSKFGRSVLFGALVGGSAYFLVRRLWPLIARSINPVYAAKTIEESSPALKNSLINLLLFRGRRTEISDAVYKTLEEQAAHRLTRVPVDAAVDRGPLIRLGYVLLAVVALAAIYKIVSPKDPLITAERVLMPWAEIVPASRVQISAVEPGNTTIAKGEFVEISADVRGLDESDPVMLRFTTGDGQAVGKAVAMKAIDGGLRFACRLPENSESAGSLGLMQSIHYRIEAGDARSLDYQVTVIPSPTILVQRVDYDYPDYTGYQDRTVEQLGDIRAIEGTKITLHAQANGPIDEAMVDFEADGRRDLTMRIEGDQARAEFILALREDRTTPRYSSYVLRFTNQEGRANRDPVKHPIDVVPDYAPEVEILEPREKSLDLRLNDTLEIEIQAIDPDFALGALSLKGEAPGRAEIDVKLLEADHAGRFMTRYRFTPGDLGLRAGDVVQLWAVAHDNRSPQPNTTLTDRRILRIVSPDPNEAPPPDRIAQRDPARNQDQANEPDNQNGRGSEQGQPAGDEGQGAESQQGGEAARGNEQSGEAENNQLSRQGGDEGGDSNSREEGTNQTNQEGDQPQNGLGDSGVRGAESESTDREGQSSTGDQQGGQQDSQGRGGENGEPGSTSSQSGESGESPNRGQGSQQSGERRPGESPEPGETDEGGDAQPAAESQNSGPDQSGAGASGGDRPGDGSRPDGAQNGPRAQGNRQNANERAGDASSQEPSPVSSDGDNDAEAFERISDHLEQSGQLNQNQREAGTEQPTSEGQNSVEPSGHRSDGSRSDADQRPPQGAQPPDADDSHEADATDQPPQTQPNDRNAQDGDAAEGQPNEAPTPTGDTSSNGENQPGASKQDAGEGSGAETGKEDLPQDANPNNSPDQGEPSPGGQQTNSRGEAGGGEQPEETSGSPTAEEPTKPTEKREQQGSSDDSQADETEPPSPGQGRRETESQGEQGGDRPGGAEEGGAQKSPRDGTGSAGQNQSADEGAGESAERGEGNDSPGGGAEKIAQEPTGRPGSETPGEGSTRRAASDPEQQRQQPPGENQRGENSSHDADRPGKAPSPDGEQTNDAQKGGDQMEREGDNSAAPGGNQPGSPEGDFAPQAPGTRPRGDEGTMPDGDEANLEYARKQTDLVLEKLSEQLKNKKVDQELLDKLGWTQEELDQFVARWQQRKQAARSDSPNADAAKRELDDALRSIGPLRGPTQQNNVREDTQRDLSQGYRGAVPLEYQERLKAYNQGVSRSRQAQE